MIEKRNESEVFFFFADEPRDPRLELRPRGIPLPPRNPKLPPQQQQPSRSQPRPRPRPPSSRSSRAPALLLESISKRDAAPSSTPRAAGITGCALRKAPETFPHTYIEAPRRAAWMSAREPAARCSCGTRSSRARDNKESRVSSGKSSRRPGCQPHQMFDCPRVSRGRRVDSDDRRRLMGSSDLPSNGRDVSHARRSGPLFDARR